MNKSTMCVIQYIIGNLIVLFGLMNTMSSFINDKNNLLNLVGFIALTMVGYFLSQIGILTYRKKLHEPNILFDWIQQSKDKLTNFIGKHLPKIKIGGILLIFLLVIPLMYWTNVTGVTGNSGPERIWEDNKMVNEYELLQHEFSHTLIFYSKLIVLFITTTLIMSYLYLKTLIANRKLDQNNLRLAFELVNDREEK